MSSDQQSAHPKVIIIQDIKKSTLERLDALEAAVKILVQKDQQRQKKSEQRTSASHSSAHKRNLSDVSIEIQPNNLLASFVASDLGGKPTMSIHLNITSQLTSSPYRRIISKLYSRLLLKEEEQSYPGRGGHGHDLHLNRNSPQHVLLPPPPKNWKELADFDNIIRIAALNNSFLCPRSSVLIRNIFSITTSPCSPAPYFSFLYPRSSALIRNIFSITTLPCSQFFSPYLSILHCHNAVAAKAQILPPHTAQLPGHQRKTTNSNYYPSNLKQQPPHPETRRLLLYDLPHTENNFLYPPIPKSNTQSILAATFQRYPVQNLPAKHLRRKRRGDRKGRIRKITLQKKAKTRYKKLDNSSTSPVNNTHSSHANIHPLNNPPRTIPKEDTPLITDITTHIAPHHVEIQVKHWSSPRPQALITPPTVQSQTLLSQILSKLSIPQQASNQIIMKINNKKVDPSSSLPLQLKDEDTVDLSLRLLGGTNKRKQPQVDTKEEDYLSDDDDLNVYASSNNEHEHAPANLPTPENNNWSHQKDTNTQKQTANRVAINIATINFNGSTSVMQLKDTTQLAKFIKDRDIHILSLTDHRSSMEQLRGITSQISRIAQRDTQLAAASEKMSDNSNRHARVGGTAIILIGKLAHAHATTTTLDKSSTNFITSTVLQYEKDLAPPLIIHSIYMFPTNTSRGPVTANTRLHAFISDKHPLSTPSTTQWMHNLIFEQISQLEEKHPNAIQIIAGDLNHREWLDTNNPKTKLFTQQLQFQNLPFDQEHERSLSSSSFHKETKTFMRHIRDKTTGQPKDTSRWIDHILTKGNIIHSSHYADHKHDIVQDLDHIPFVARMTLPNSFADHTINHKAYLRAQQLNNYKDVNTRLPHIIEKYQTHLCPLNTEIIENDTLAKIETMNQANLEELLSHINESLVQAATKTNPSTNLNRPIAQLWSPTRELQRRTRLAISSSLSIMKQLENPENKKKKRSVTPARAPTNQKKIHAPPESTLE